MSSDHSSRRNTFVLLLLGAIAIGGAMVWLMVDRIRFDATPKFSEETLVPSYPGAQTQASVVDRAAPSELAQTAAIDPVVTVDAPQEVPGKLTLNSPEAPKVALANPTMEETAEVTAKASPPSLDVTTSVIDETVAQPPAPAAPVKTEAPLVDVTSAPKPAAVTDGETGEAASSEASRPEIEPASDEPELVKAVEPIEETPLAVAEDPDVVAEAEPPAPEMQRNDSLTEPAIADDLTASIDSEPLADPLPKDFTVDERSSPNPEPDVMIAAAPASEPRADIPQVAASPGNFAAKDTPGTLAVDTEPASVSADPASPDAPKFDLVRVDAEGAAVIAGTAAPGAQVKVVSDGRELGSATANSSGQFVALVNADVTEPAQTIALLASVDGGPLVKSADSVVVLGRKTAPASGAATTELPAGTDEEAIKTAALTETEDEPIAPAVITATDEGIRILQPSAILPDQVSLDSISYDEEGEVVITGRGRPGNRVWLYVDETRSANTVVSSGGTWQATLAAVDKGRYVLRADEIGKDGAVLSRAESPFQREFPTADKLALLNSDKEVIVQPGNNLWNIAKLKYGDGFKYWVIFDANEDQIRDPDLIYPGQIFALPDEN